MGISVIIPTTCESDRRTSLLRAIDSVLNQQGTTVELIVVANGSRVDPALLNSLRARSDLRLFYLDTGNLPLAQRYGRSQVTQDFFAFLDDDDEYLPGALATRVAPMLKQPDLDVVVTNGYRMGQGEHIQIKNGAAVNSDPLLALMSENWMASCAGLFRTSAITREFFDGKTNFFEWTLMAFRIVSAGHKLTFLDVPTYRIHDTPNSLSKSEEYQRAVVQILELLLTFDSSPGVRRALKEKLANAFHSVSDSYKQIGDRSQAWQYHLKSLLQPGGLKYLTYTRRLLF